MSRSDLEYWLDEWLPVIFVVYDALADVAYWVYVQAHFQQQEGFNLSLTGKTVTLHIDRSNEVNVEAIRRFARFKSDILRQRPQEIRYDEQ